MFTEIRALSKWLKSSALTHPAKMRGVMNNERDVFITFFSDSSVEAVKGNLLGIKCSSSWFLLMEINIRWLDIYVKTTACCFYLYSRKLHSGQSKILRHFFSSVHPFVFICVYTLDREQRRERGSEIHSEFKQQRNIPNIQRISITPAVKSSKVRK